MRKICIALLVLTLFALMGCTEREMREPDMISAYLNMGTNEKSEMTVGEKAVDILEFSSVEAFLNAYLIMNDKKTGNIEELVSNYWCSASDFNMMDIATAADLEFLETIHFPVGIPEDFELGRIRVSEWNVVLHFFHKNDSISEETMQEAELEQRHFSFHFHRTNMQGIEEEAPQFFGENFIAWASNGVLFGIYIPLQRQTEIMMATENGGISLDNPYEMLRFTETIAINLRDNAAVEALISELAER